MAMPPMPNREVRHPPSPSGHAAMRRLPPGLGADQEPVAFTLAEARWLGSVLPVRRRGAGVQRCVCRKLQDLDMVSLNHTHFWGDAANRDCIGLRMDYIRWCPPKSFWSQNAHSRSSKMLRPATVWSGLDVMVETSP